MNVMPGLQKEATVDIIRGQKIWFVGNNLPLGQGNFKQKLGLWLILSSLLEVPLKLKSWAPSDAFWTRKCGCGALTTHDILSDLNASSSVRASAWQSHRIWMKGMLSRSQEGTIVSVSFEASLSEHRAYPKGYEFSMGQEHRLLAKGHF